MMQSVPAKNAGGHSPPLAGESGRGGAACSRAYDLPPPLPLPHPPRRGQGGEGAPLAHAPTTCPLPYPPPQAGEGTDRACGEAMPFTDIIAALKSAMPALRGRLLASQSLAELTWFRVGGPAQALFMPEDESDLAYFLGHLAPEIPLTVIGLGSNLIVRDGGVAGVVIRLGRGFSDVAIEPGARVRAGAALPDMRVAKAAQEAAIAGLAFLRGIPGAIGGALCMNGGAYGGETKDILIEARGVDRSGKMHVFTNADMRYTYRHCGVPEDVIFTQALFQGQPGDASAIAAEVGKLNSLRGATR